MQYLMRTLRGGGGGCHGALITLLLRLSASVSIRFSTTTGSKAHWSLIGVLMSALLINTHTCCFLWCSLSLALSVHQSRALYPPSKHCLRVYTRPSKSTESVPDMSSHAFNYRLEAEWPLLSLNWWEIQHILHPSIPPFSVSIPRLPECITHLLAHRKMEANPWGLAHEETHSLKQGGFVLLQAPPRLLFFLTVCPYMHDSTCGKVWMSVCLYSTPATVCLDTIISHLFIIFD